VAYRVGTAFFFVFLYVLLIFLVADIVRFTHLTHIEHFMTHSWAGAGILIFIVSTIFIYGNINYHNKKRTEINIEIEKPLGENGKLKMLLISDLHLGYGIGRAELDKWVKLLNAENADVILVAGDVIDRFARPLEEEQMYKSLNDLKARYGVFMALGNHDFLGNIAENLAFLQKTNFTLLRDTAVLVDSSFYIAGRNDYSQSARLPLAAILQNADATKPLFLIDHQPNNLNDAEQNGIDLQVSGHTHYGQIFPINLIEKLIFEKPYGYLKKNDTHYFISSGLGIWGGKFRIGSRSEYVVINIVGL
jgi:predicted MPP superfamily phosphohydrolase